jgi:hypothetical protein
MDQENAHIKTLVTARNRMIQDRRNLADVLARSLFAASQKLARGPWMPERCVIRE